MQKFRKEKSNINWYVVWKKSDGINKVRVLGLLTYQIEQTNIMDTCINKLEETIFQNFIWLLCYWCCLHCNWSVVPCGGRKTSPRTSDSADYIFFRLEDKLRNQKFMIVLDYCSRSFFYHLDPFWIDLFAVYIYMSCGNFKVWPMFVLWKC